MTAAKLTIKIDNSDGTKMECEVYLPYEIADHIASLAISWKQSFLITPSAYERFEQDRKRLIENGNS